MMIRCVVALTTVALLAVGGGAARTATDPLSLAFPPPEYLSFPLVEPLLSNLQSGETAEIRITTTHCFGGSIYELHFNGPAPFRVVVTGRADAVAGGELASLGTTIVTKAEAQRIDRVLAYYRAGPKDYYCTTRADISANWHTAAGSKTEKWSDSSCVVNESDLSLSLYTVAERAKHEP